MFNLMFSSLSRFLIQGNLRQGLMKAQSRFPTLSVFEDGVPALCYFKGLQNVGDEFLHIGINNDEQKTDLVYPSLKIRENGINRKIASSRGSGDYLSNSTVNNRAIIHTIGNNTTDRGCGRSWSLVNSRRAAHTSSDDDPSLAWKRGGKVFNKGPEQILPSDAIYTWHAEGAVRISKLGKGELAERTPVSVPALLERAARRAPDRTALAVKRNNVWQKWTFKQYLQDSRKAAKAFIKLGLEPYHSVCILGFNAPEWFIANMGAILAGGLATGIYTTNSSEACAYVGKDSNANIFIVEDEEQLQKIVKCKSELPKLKAIIQYIGQPKVPGVYSWRDLMKLGEQEPDTGLTERLKNMAVNQCCSLIYTSGTTGNPKGVMLSHDNMTWLAYVTGKYAGFKDNDECVSFLPLSHVAAQMADIYCSLNCCASVFFADPDALKGTLLDTLKEVQPTKFLAVPRVWEKMYDKMQEVARSTTGIKKTIGTWAKEQALNYNKNRMEGVQNPGSLGFKIADKLILSKIRAALGLNRCDLQLSGAAPINPEILLYFMSLNIVICEAYGMSECAGPHTMCIESAFRLGSVGKTLPGATTRLDKPDAEGTGEICMGGRHIHMGYLNQPEKTIECMDQQGWLHSEDVGKVDEDGFVFITGRLKELLITAGGENVAPVPIEDNVKTALPIVSQAMVVGNKLKFLSILLTLKTDIDEETQEPLDTLIPFTREWINKNGDCNVKTVQNVIDEIKVKKNLKLTAAIQAGIDEANQKAISRAQNINKWCILPKDFSIHGGEFGPTLKLKRSVVAEKYQDIIDEFYHTKC